MFTSRTVAGLALYLVIYGSVGAVFGLALASRTPALASALIGVLVGLGWYYLSFTLFLAEHESAHSTLHPSRPHDRGPRTLRGAAGPFSALFAAAAPCRLNPVNRPCANFWPQRRISGDRRGGMAGRATRAGAGLGKLPARSAARDRTAVRATLCGHPAEIVCGSGERFARDAGDLSRTAMRCGDRQRRALLPPPGDRRQGSRPFHRPATPRPRPRKRRRKKRWRSGCWCGWRIRRYFPPGSRSANAIRVPPIPPERFRHPGCR